MSTSYPPDAANLQNLATIQANLANFQTQLATLIAANATGITFTPAQMLQMAEAVNGLILIVTGQLGTSSET